MVQCVDSTGRPVPLLAAPPSISVPGPVIVCPWLATLPVPEGLWLSILPIHDANAYLTIPVEPVAEGVDVYWGVLALDPSRSQDALLRLAEARGIKGIINLPSVGLFDGRTRQTFQRLGYSIEAEIEFLERATAKGFRTLVADFDGARSRPQEQLARVHFSVPAASPLSR